MHRSKQYYEPYIMSLRSFSQSLPNSQMTKIEFTSLLFNPDIELMGLMVVLGTFKSLSFLLEVVENDDSAIDGFSPFLIPFNCLCSSTIFLCHSFYDIR